MGVPTGRGDVDAVVALAPASAESGADPAGDPLHSAGGEVGHARGRPVGRERRNVRRRVGCDGARTELCRLDQFRHTGDRRLGIRSHRDRKADQRRDHHRLGRCGGVGRGSGTDEFLHAELEHVRAVGRDGEGLGEGGLACCGERTTGKNGGDHSRRDDRAQGSRGGDVAGTTCSRCRRDGRQREPQVCAPALGPAVPCHYLFPSGSTGPGRTSLGGWVGPHRGVAVRVRSVIEP